MELLWSSLTPSVDGCFDFAVSHWLAFGSIFGLKFHVAIDLLADGQPLVGDQS